MPHRLLISTALSLIALGTASATDWIPGEAGDRQHFTRTVFPSTTTIPGVTSGDEVQARVVHRQGGWRLWSDFVGLGPRWVHSGQGEQVYLYDGLQARLLVDLATTPGYVNTLQTLDLSDGVRVEAWLRQRKTEVTTRRGTYPCAEVLLTVYNPDTTQEQRTLYLAPEVGLVRWQDDKNPYDFGVYYQPVFVQHDLEPAPMAPGRVDLPGAQDALRIGDRAFVARGASGLSLVDLRTGSVERTHGIPAERVYRNGDSVVVHGRNASGATEVHSVTDLGAPLRLPFTHPVLPSREGGWWGTNPRTVFVRLESNRIEAFDDLGASLGSASFVGTLSAERFSWDRGRWGMHSLPLASGGVLSLDAARPWADAVTAPTPVHDVQVLNGTTFVATRGGLLLQRYASSTAPTHTYDPVLSEPVGQLQVGENRLWALTADSLVEVDDQGQVFSRTTLSNVPDLSSMRHGLLDVQRGQALLLIAGEGLRVVGR